MVESPQRSSFLGDTSPAQLIPSMLAEDASLNSSPVSAPETKRPPKVSVLIITYNHSKYIAQALESVLMQKTNFDFEINVLDDCSTDGTQDVVMRYARQYPHIIRPYLN